MTKITTLIFFLLSMTAMSWASEDPKDVEVENAYVNADGKMIIRFAYKSSYADKDKTNPDFFGSNLTFYGDASGFHQLEERGFGGSEQEFNLSFEDGPNRQNGKFEANPKEGKFLLTCGADTQSFKQLSAVAREKLQADVRSGKIKLASLPKEARKPEYFFKVKDTEDYIYVDAPKYNYSQDFHVFIGPKGNMKEVKTSQVSRLRDGGTTRITLADGKILFAPVGFRAGQKPSWDGHDLQDLDATAIEFSSFGLKDTSKQVALRTPCEKFASRGSPRSQAPQSGRRRGNQ